MIIAFLCEVNVLLKIKTAKHIEASKKIKACEIYKNTESCKIFTAKISD